MILSKYNNPSVFLISTPIPLLEVKISPGLKDFPDNEFQNRPNIISMPHLGASTKEAKEGVSRAICEQVRECLLHDKLTNALNMPISDLDKLKENKPYFDLAEILGHIQSQIAEGPISYVSIECFGTANEIKPISLAFLKGLLKSHVPERINYINAETIARELGVVVDLRYSSTETSYII